MAVGSGSTVIPGAGGHRRAALPIPAAVLVGLLVGLVAGATPASAQTVALGVVAELDSAARAHVESEIIAGVSVAVVHRGETLLQRGYGYVDLEWSVETPRNGGASYEIGSVTKQFTAAAAMLLVEEGKLDLEADFTDYVDFDTQGHTVPVRRLLDHTSGIKGYTEMPVFGEFSPLKLPRDSLMRIVEQEPFDFEPGSAQIYNNSAYFLLGLIIEAVSGQSYEDFVAERLFAPTGMADSYYCSEALVREGRAHGYDAVSPEMVIRARYLDHTWPYAAGSLCSTVGDLVRWNQALHGGALLRPGSYRAMTTPSPLEDGTPIRYAMGLQVHDPGGRLVIQHGGGINGFLSDGRYYPDDDLLVVVLQNSTGPVGPGSLAAALVEIVLGPAPAGLAGRSRRDARERRPDRAHVPVLPSPRARRRPLPRRALDPPARRPPPRAAREPAPGRARPRPRVTPRPRARALRPQPGAHRPRRRHGELSPRPRPGAHARGLDWL